MYNNTTFDKEPSYLDHIIIHLSVATFITLLNSLVIFIYINMKRKRKKIPNYLMFAQALVDLYQGCIAWYEAVIHILVSLDVMVPLYITEALYAGEYV